MKRECSSESQASSEQRIACTSLVVWQASCCHGPYPWRNGQVQLNAKRTRNYGGEGGIRTPDTLSGMAAFEAARFNRSRTSPRQKQVSLCQQAEFQLVHSSSRQTGSYLLPSLLLRKNS